MSKPIVDSQSFCQVGIVVRDIKATSQRYARVLGVPVPEPVITGTLKEANTRHLGKPTEAQAKLAFFQVGSVSLELIEPIGGPSTWKNFLDTRGEGVHHIAFSVKGMDDVLAALASEGMPLEQKGDFPGGRYAYVDSSKDLKVILELLEDV